MRQGGTQQTSTASHVRCQYTADVMLIGRIDALQEMQHASSARRGDILLMYVDLERWSKCTARKVRGFWIQLVSVKRVFGLPVCYCLVETLHLITFNLQAAVLDLGSLRS